MKLFHIFCFIGITACSSSSKKPFLIWPTNMKTISRTMTASHDGIDIPVPSGSRLYAVHNGVVVGSQYSSTYGKFIIIESNEWGFLYAHLSRSLVKRKDSVTQGQVIGYSGSSGSGTGPHLHFELLKNKQPINPLPYLNK